MTQPGMRTERRQLEICYLSRSDIPQKLPSLTGKWTTKKSVVFQDDINNEFISASDEINFRKNNSIYLKIGEKADSGTWVFNAKTGAIDMKLTKGIFRSNIISIEKNNYSSRIELADPYYSENMIKLTLQQQYPHPPYYGLDSSSRAVAEDSNKSDMKYDSLYEATGIRSDYFRNWQGYKIVANGFDSIHLSKSVSLLILKNNQYILTINNKKISGSWRFDDGNGIIIFTHKKKDNLAQFEFNQDENTNISTLNLTIVLPGENEVKTYVFK